MLGSMGQFTSLFAMKIQISSYVADHPGGIGKRIIHSPFFFLSSDLDPMVWDYKTEALEWVRSSKHSSKSLSISEAGLNT